MENFNFYQEFDMKDLKAVLATVMPKDDEAFVRDDNKALLEHAFGEMTTFLEKRSRKRKKEVESYKMALKSQHGWRTTNVYHDDDTFKDSDDDEKEFWELPDLKPEEKQARFHKAEVEVKFQLTNKKFLANNQFFDKKPYRSARGRGGGTSFGGRSDGNLRFDGGYQSGHRRGANGRGGSGGRGGGWVPIKDRQCRLCEEFGHIAPQCTKGGSVPQPRGK